MQTSQTDQSSQHVRVSFQTLICKYFIFRACYQRVFSAQRRAARRRNSKYMEGRRKKCVECNQVKEFYARDMCRQVSKTQFVINFLI
jgi:hypothetical protein